MSDQSLSLMGGSPLSYDASAGPRKQSAIGGVSPPQGGGGDRKVCDAAPGRTGGESLARQADEQSESREAALAATGVQ